MSPTLSLPREGRAFFVEAKQMPSQFRRALMLVGFTRRQAALVLGVSESSIDKWSRGVTQPPPGVWAELAQIWKDMRASVKMADMIPSLSDGARENARAMRRLELSADTGE